MPDDNDQNLNPGQSDYNQKFDFNPSKSSTNDNSDENQNYSDNISKTANELKDAEENPNTDYINNFTGENNQSAKQKLNIKNLKKKAPLIITSGGIIITILIGLFGNISIMGPSILANIDEIFGTNQQFSANYRFNKLVSNMMTKEITSGSCTTKITIFCRFNGLSKNLLTRLNKNGIKALDADGNEIKETEMIFKNKPKYYSFTSTSGDTLKVSASEVFNTAATNTEFRAALRSVSSTKYFLFNDDVFKSIKAKFGFSTGNKLADATSEENIVNEIDDALKNADNDAIKSTIAEGGDAAENEIKKIITEEATDSVEKITDSGKSGAVNLAIGATCIATDIPGLVTSASRSIQMVQLIKYSSYFLSAFGAMKAGDATPEEVSAVNNLLTKTVNGKSAMESFGMKYIMTGDKTPTNTNYKKFVPGASVANYLKKITSITDSPEKKETCAIGMNPVTGFAIDAALAETGVGILPALVNLGIGFVASTVLENILPPIIESVVSVIPVEKFATAFFGDITDSVKDGGEGLGDALGSGAGAIYGQTANAGGNIPLTISQAVDNNKLIAAYKNQIAEEEVATKSPFDTSSRYTFLGNIFSSLSSIYINAKNNQSSILTGIGMISKTVSNSIASIINPSKVSAVSYTAEEYSLCDDPNIQGKVASDPFCNIIYGIPSEYLNIDPDTILDELLADKQIDEETGDPIKGSKLQKWIDMCTDGKSTEAANCTINENDNGEHNEVIKYALYTIDHRIIEYYNGAE